MHWCWHMLGAGIGVTGNIYPRFQPLQRHGRKVEVVLRGYGVGGLALLLLCSRNAKSADLRIKPDTPKLGFLPDGAEDAERGYSISGRIRVGPR
jgi:hypothetical protein